MRAQVPDPDGVRARIFAAGRAEFASKGREGASVHAVARRAGVTAAMINYYFGGKQPLYDEVVAEAQGRLLACLSAALPAARGARLVDAAELAPLVAGAYFDFLAEDRELQRLFLREVLDQGEHAGRLGRFVAPLGGLLAKHFGRSDEVTQLAISLFGAVAGYFLYEPLLAELLGVDPLSPGALRRRRRHVVALAQTLSSARPSPGAPRTRPTTPKDPPT